ncbi:NUDIX hydrolase [Chloroflexi bacterium]|nr:ADP-ribose pyrophosphatase [Chloroflexota bacterium]MDC0252577.1 NUDIX hydrolase [Chloroflexota bacterium]RZP14259.1 MAG: NUDIX hydrolase [Chloroflexota bacterium]|tara:strand:+ start:10611 stop:11129 length:519 start_codon:yes stop_codon:yes gene_type:complete
MKNYEGTNLIFQSDSIHIRRDQYKTSNKVIINKDFVDHPGSVLIIGLRREKILFVKQWRQPVKKYTLELPCGTLNAGEDTILAANREFREETGFGANIYKSFGSFFVAPGYSSEITEYFIAEDLFESPLEPDVDEEIELEEYTLDEAFKLIKTNKIIDQGTISALNIYKSIL